MTEANEQYTGVYIAGRTYQDESGRKYHTPPSEWIIIPDKYPAIVSKEVFEQVKALTSQGKRKMQPNNYLLKGKIVCGSCGHAMIYGNTTTQPMYRCMKTHADPTAACHKLKVSVAEVESAIMTIIKKRAELVLETGDLSELRKANMDEKRITECEKQIRQYVEQRQNYYEQFIQGELDRDTFNTLKDDCSKQLDKLNNWLTLLKQVERDSQANRKVTVLAKEALRETATPQDIVNALVDKVAEARPGDLIFFQGTYDTKDSRIVTHVGNYLGNGQMQHSGTPNQITSINSAYWQKHFYSFGRLRR